MIITQFEQHTDAELIERARTLVADMNHGDRWRMSIPVHRDDSDILLSELVDRFEALKADSTRLDKLEAWAHEHCSAGWQEDIVECELINEPDDELDDDAFVPEYQWNVSGPKHPLYPSGGVTIVGQGATLRAAIDDAETRGVTGEDFKDHE